MIKVLIVDDNKIERESLHACIDWSSIGAEIIGEAGNGFAALEIIVRDQPDILITDIKMPHMDGIELARKAASMCPKIKIIFLTGFEEFELAKDAVKVHALGYVLKPVSTSDFYDILKEAIDATIQNNLAQEKERNLKRQLTETLPILKDKFIRDLLLGIEDTDEAKLAQKVEFLGLRIKSGRFLVLVIRFDDYENTFAPISEAQKHIIIIAASNIIKSLISPFIDNYFITSNCSYRNGYELSVILNFDLKEVLDDIRFFNDIENVCQEIQDRILSECGFGITVGISNLASNLSDLNNLYEQALLASSHKFYKGKGNIIKYRDINMKAENLTTINYLYYESEITKLLKAGNHDGITILIDKLFSQVCEINVSIKYVQNIFIEIVCAIKRALMDTGEDADSIIKDTLFISDKLLKLETIHDIRNCICEICKSVLEYFEEKRKDVQTIRVNKVIELMHKHIESNISIDEIARQVYLTQNYLRRIFKEKTGENLLEYFTRLKMEKGKELLINTNLKINEIAKRVGYESTSYFCSLFKSYTNYTPKEYKDTLVK